MVESIQVKIELFKKSSTGDDGLERERSECVGEERVVVFGSAANLHCVHCAEPRHSSS